MSDPKLKAVYRHADGDLYVVMKVHGQPVDGPPGRDTLSLTMKMDDGRWEPAVAYSPVIGVGGGYPDTSQEFVTTFARFAERFTEMDPSL